MQVNCRKSSLSAIEIVLYEVDFKLYQKRKTTQIYTESCH